MNISNSVDKSILRIIEKDSVIIQRGNYYKAFIIKNKPQRLGRPGEGQILINFISAVGYPYGIQLKLFKEKKNIFNLTLPEENSVDCLDIDVESGFDNRNICDDGQSQQLSKSDIQQLVASGKSGDEVIQTLVENNKTFKSKTKYAQEKYVSKKQKKYIEFITIHKPTIQNLAHMYYQHDPLRISNMRIDSLSQLLSYSNVQPGGTFAVYEAGIHGLVTASMLKRMGSKGALIHVFSGEYPHRDAIDLLNFDEDILKTLSFIRSDQLPQFSSEENDEQKTDEIDDPMCSEPSRKRKNEDESPPSRSLNSQCKKKFVRSRYEDLKRSVLMLSQSLHGFVVACKQDPAAITLALLSYLKAGHSFVVFSPYKEPLLDLYMELKNENCVNLRISENWLRNYQVLPERTHPEVSMSGGGGFLLTGIKVDNF